MKITQHFKTLFLITSFLLLIITVQNYAQWSNDPTINTPISTAVGNQYDSKIVSDGSGGAIIVWKDDHSGPDSIYIYAQSINASGIAQWGDNGVTIITGSISNFIIISDGLGGVIITWESYITTSESNIYAQRINALGGIQWNPNGVAICTAINHQNISSIVTDEFGGAIIVWDDNRLNGTNTFDIYAQRINSLGAVQWTTNGIAICTAPDDQLLSKMISDGSGGAIITWQDKRNTLYFDIYSQRINASGNVQWTVNGVTVCSASLNQTNPNIVSDNSGGAIITWTDYRDLINTNSNIYAQFINASGIVQWITDGIAVCADINYQENPQIVSDNLGGAIITWEDSRNFTNTQFDIYAQRVNTSGIFQWITDGIVICSEIGNQLFPLIVSNNSDGAIIAWSDFRNITNTQGDIYAQNINASGLEQWTSNGVAISTAINDQQIPTIVSDSSGGAIITWTDWRSEIYADIYAQKYPPTSPLQITKPTPYSKFIAGEKDTIKWTDAGWAAVNIKCITNFETPLESELILAQGIPNANSKFVWNVPDTTLSFRSKIIIENADNPTEKIESDIFRIKPYVLTRLNPDSTYYEYRKDRDQWGFSNTRADMWPPTWYNQFDYQGIDPFTSSQYSQWQGDNVFENAIGSDHMDWVSWVNTFSVNACYTSTDFGIYKPAAMEKWNAWKKLLWNGSCFGIAVANALAFSHREQFKTKYPNFPAFINPITVISDTGVNRVVNELFTHQYGNPHLAIRKNIGLIKTPTQTLKELIVMLKEDSATIRTLSILNNGVGGGGHAILAYGLEKDPVNPNVFHIKVYDNSNPNSNNRIRIDTSANFNNGNWSTPDWAGWGGFKWIYLRNPTIDYLTNPTLAKGTSQQSPFILENDELEIFNTISASIQIRDNFGNQTGFNNNLIQIDIPGSVPLVVDNGSETPPYGYSLFADNYSVVLNDFAEDTVETFFFSGNKSFMYERSGAIQTQTDRIFFDGGVSVSNPDAQTKTIKLLNLINETTQEKLFVARSLELAQNDSVKIENPDSNKVKLISYGTAKEYDLELNYVTENGIGRFGDFSIPLSANSSHTFVPVWTDITNTELQVLVDIGNDGTIDDTLSLVNQVTGIGEDQGSLLTPDSYNLAQNYPNPFNPSTKISWQSPIGSHQILKIYDVLGNEVATLVNEYREAGRYEITFDASNLSSGIYFYRLQAGSFVETKKMILIK